MSNYQLNIVFDEVDLQTVRKAQEQVVIVKHTSQNTKDVKVAWVSFDPFMKNTVKWNTKYALYASTSEIKNQAQISKLSDKDAATKIRYSFVDAVFKDAVPVRELGDNTYALRNNMMEYRGLTFGLAQDIVVNDEAFPNHPINALYTPYGRDVEMTPVEEIEVYMKRDVDQGTVISHIASISLPVVYTENETSHTIVYDGSTGKFVPRS